MQWQRLAPAVNLAAVQASSVVHLLDGLILNTEAVKARQADTGQAAVALMTPHIVAAAGTASSLTGSSMHDCHAPLTARQPCRHSQLITIRPFTAGALRTACDRLAATAAADAQAAGLHSQSCPGTVRRSTASRTCWVGTPGSSTTCAPGSLGGSCGSSSTTSPASHVPDMTSAARGASWKPANRSSTHSSTRSPLTSARQETQHSPSIHEHSMSAMKCNRPGTPADCQCHDHQEQPAYCSGTLPRADNLAATGRTRGKCAVEQQPCDDLFITGHPGCDDCRSAYAAATANVEQSEVDDRLAACKGCGAAAGRSPAISCQLEMTAGPAVQLGFLSATCTTRARPLPSAVPLPLLAAVQRSAALNSIELHLPQHTPVTGRSRQPSGRTDHMASTSRSLVSTHQAGKGGGGLVQEANGGQSTARGPLQLPWDLGSPCSSPAGVDCSAGSFCHMTQGTVPPAVSLAMLAGAGERVATASQQHEPGHAAAGARHTPGRVEGICRSNRAPPSCAQPMPGGVFCEVDMGAWKAAESAADIISWALGADLSRVGRERQLQHECSTAAAQRRPGQQHARQQCEDTGARTVRKGCKQGAGLDNRPAGEGALSKRACRGQRGTLRDPAARSLVPRLQLNQLQQHHGKH
jgi:hypothetical protein